jgi:hypothetical protein
MKYFALFGIILFVIFAAVQINDPDSYIWIPIYLFPAFMSFKAFKGQYPKWPLLIPALAYLAFSLITFPSLLSTWVMDELNNTSLSMKSPSMEEARESLGCMICFMFLGIYFLYSIFSKQASKSISKI